MIIVNRVEDLISGSVNGKSFSVSYDEDKYKEMLELEEKANQAATMDELKAIVSQFEPLTKESFKELVETATPYIFVNKHNNKFYLKYNNVLSSKPLPQLFVDMILKSVEKKTDITPLIKCWVRFLRNPNYTDRKAALLVEYISAPYVKGDYRDELLKEGFSHEVATERATVTQVAITRQGLLVCYKVSKEIRHKFTLDDDDNVKSVSRYRKSVDPDTGIITYSEPQYAEERLYEPPVQGQNGDAFLCIPYGGDQTNAPSGHFIRVGHTIMLDSWDKVNTNDDQSCVKGLHVGGLRYIQGYQNEGTITHDILVDPMDIGAIVGLGTGNDGAMRVRRYFVFATFEQVNQNAYHSSEIAKLNDAEYAVMVQEAVNKTRMKAEESSKLLDEQIALL